MTRITTTVCLVVALGLLPAASTTVRGQQREGINVHGHWTIDVRNPDGTLASHREFENALVVGAGSSSLARILAADLVPGGVDVILNSPTGVCAVSGQGARCFLYEPAIMPPGTGGPNTFSTLQRSLTAAGLVLTGTLTGTLEGDIDSVQTVLHFCSAQATAAACVSGQSSGAGAADLTSATLSPAQHVRAGQIIQVTVTLSFS